MDVPLWLEPHDIERWRNGSPVADESADKSANLPPEPYFIVKEYGPFVREWHLDFQYIDHEGEPAVKQIRSLEDAQSFGEGCPAQLAYMIVSAKEAFENFFGRTSSEAAPPSATGTTDTAST